jgi:hypothetical protein
MGLTPASLITRATLDGVTQIYQTNVLPVDPDTCVLWDCLQVAGCEVLASEVEDVVEADSVLHRWIVLDAIQSAESVPQGVEGTAAIEAARVWVANPSKENRVAYASYASYAYAYAVSNAAYAYAYAAAAYAAYAASNTAASVSARLRFRVLATMAQAGVLPEPEMK